MVSKKAWILTGGLIVGATLALLFDRDRGPVDARLGGAVLSAAELPAITSIALAKGEGRLLLLRGEDQTWRLDIAHGFPVDANRVVRLLDDLARATYQTVAATKLEQHAELGLDVATRLVLKAGERELLSLRLGNQRSGGGRYLSVGDEDRVYLVDQTLSVTVDAADWEMKTLLDLKADQIQSVRYEPAASLKKEPVTLTREKAEDPFKVEGLADTAQAKPAVQSVGSQLSGINFSKRHDPSNEEAKAALASPSRVSVTLFDGRRYELLVGSVGDKTKKYFLKIEASAPETADAAARSSAEGLNQIMAQYAFEVLEYIATRFEKGRGDFVEAAAKG